ncbi:hypothetical protein [Clostridium saccharoperbutylacetonicum]|uniref:hypothetical protein n=1 Tax=Clostridium saccharoperbutylacetonicum TaxID=36745 RepID=UPI0039ECCA2F
MEKLKEKLNKIMVLLQSKANAIKLLITSIIFTVIAPHAAYASTNYGENFGKYSLDQLFWVAIVIGAVALIGCAAKRNVVGLIGTIIICVIVVGFMADPTGVKSVGQDIWGTIKG